MAIIKVVKYNGNPNVFAYKYPSEELGTWTQLIVNESQEAVLFKEGRALDVFQSGRHTLETANIPLINKFINLPFGGLSPFTAEVWFVNKVYSMDIKWGTTSPIQLQDPKYKIFVPLRAFGQFGIKIDNSEQFLMKLVGTLPIFDKTNLIKYFRGLYLTKVKDSISSYLVHKQIGILEINAYIDELSEYLKSKIEPVFAEYGIHLVNFYVNDISVPEDDPAVKQLKSALSKKAEMDIIGYNYQQERSFDTLEGAAKNTSSSSSNFMGAGLGLAMGTAVGGSFGGQLGDISKELNTQINNTQKCPSCNSTMDKGIGFCSNCGCDMFKSDGSIKKEIVLCVGCKKEFNKSMNFCPECGKKYNPCPECGADSKLGVDSCPECNYQFPQPCRYCGAILPGKNTRFCPKCGESLKKTCPNCNTPIDGSPKFCLECGQKFE